MKLLNMLVICVMITIIDYDGVGQLFAQWYWWIILAVVGIVLMIISLFFRGRSKLLSAIFLIFSVVISIHSTVTATLMITPPYTAFTAALIASLVIFFTTIIDHRVLCAIYCISMIVHIIAMYFALSGS